MFDDKSIEREPRQRQAQTCKELITFRQVIHLSAIHSRNLQKRSCVLMRPSRLFITRVALPLRCTLIANRYYSILSRGLGENTLGEFSTIPYRGRESAVSEARRIAD